MYNILVAASNLVVLPLIYNHGSNLSYLMLFPMMASFFYHLGETKHSLPGIYPFNQYTEFLLEIDRLFAMISVWFVIGIMNYHPTIITTNFLLIGFIGICSLLYSERDYLQPILIRNQLPYRWTTINRWEFTISHIIWHIIAFSCLDYSLKFLDISSDRSENNIS